MFSFMCLSVDTSYNKIMTIQHGDKCHVLLKILKTLTTQNKEAGTKESH
jgi:hypothetical protein